MSERGDFDFLHDIKEAVRRIGVYTVQMKYVDFQKDTKTQDAVIRNLEDAIIREEGNAATDD